MELQDRLKAIRKFSKLTQADFGKALGCSRDTIANYEGGRAVPTDTFLQLVCAKFPINEAWLLSEKGSMTLDSESSLFANFAKQYNLTPAEQNVTRFFLTLPPEERQQMLKYVTMLADAINGGAQDAAKIDAEVEAYRQELEAEQAAPKGKLYRSEDTDGIIA